MQAASRVAGVSALYDEDHIASVQQVSHDLKRLLAGCDAARLKTDVKLQVAKLNDWTNTYLKGLDAAQKISEAGYDTLIEAQKELALSLDDFLRFEGEGGNPPSSDQERRIEDISKALRRISGLIPAVENTFASEGPNDPEDPEIEPYEPATDPDNAPEYNPPAPDGNPELPSEIPPVTNPQFKTA
ncbi:hypothetical protein AEAC466_07195 [Asticcacaulis sp. AC466]|nr:hypothetical protein AEAC466_07195 [Asticcacaulis sp. AC466]